MSERRTCGLRRQLSGLLLFLVSIAPATAAGPRTDKYKSPRNEYGQADVRGVWNYSSDVPLQRPKEMADKLYRTRAELDKAKAERNANLEQLAQSAAVVGAHNTFWLDWQSQIEDLRTSLISYPANGRLPPLVDGAPRSPGFAAILADVQGIRPVRMFVGGIGKDGPEDRGLSERCIANSIGPPLTPGFDSNYIQIFQGRDHVVILNEQFHDARTVPLEAIEAPHEEVRGWFGYSRGHWDGDTLIVETRNFNDLTPSFDGAGTARGKVVTERFMRVSADTMNYEATIVDPNTFQDRIELMIPMTKVDKRLYEFACHEGNYSMPIILSGARKQEADAHQATVAGKSSESGGALDAGRR